MILCLSACATTVPSHAPVYFNSMGNETGIILECTKNLGQEGVVGHLITIDNEEPVHVDPISQIPIYLSPGAHKIKIISVGSLAKSTYHPYSVPPSRDKIYEFGKPSFLNITLGDNEIKRIYYKAPFLIMQSGRLTSQR